MKLFSETIPFRKANFHCHTTESDGNLDPVSVVNFYKNAGYDILAITDHRKVTEISDESIANKLLLIPGIEIDYTLPGQAVHILGLGMKKEIASLWNRSGTPQEGIDLIRNLGGLAILAHPAWSLNTPAFIRSLTGLSGVEIWNSVSTLPLNADRADSSSLLDVTFASGGELLSLCANDDSHPYKEEAGTAATMVQAEDLTIDSVMAALSTGSFYATTGPQIHQIEIRNREEMIVNCSPAEIIIFYSDTPWVGGRSIIKSGLTEARYVIQKNDHFVRIEVRDANGRKAWSSPIRTGSA